MKLQPWFTEPVDVKGVCRFTVYGETKPKKPELPSHIVATFYDRAATKWYWESRKEFEGESFGFEHVAIINVFSNGKVLFDFDNEISYGEFSVMTILLLGKQAQSLAQFRPEVEE